MLNVIVNRETWLRGEGSDKSFLLRPADGKMCCMGFAESVRNPLSDILGAREVVRADYPNHVNCLSDIYQINDNPTLSDHEREQRLIGLGPIIGINFSFTGNDDDGA